MSIAGQAKKAVAQAAKNLAVGSALRGYFQEVRRPEPRPEKLGNLISDLNALGIPFTEDWVQLHQLALREYQLLCERVKRLPEVKREQKEVAELVEQEQWTGTLAERRKRGAEYDKRAQKLFCEYTTLTDEASFRDGLRHVFPRLFQVTDSPGWASNLWAPVHNFLVGRLGIDPMKLGPDRKLRTFDVPPEQEGTNNILWE